MHFFLREVCSVFLRSCMVFTIVIISGKAIGLGKCPAARDVTAGSLLSMCPRMCSSVKRCNDLGYSCPKVSPSTTRPPRASEKFTFNDWEEAFYLDLSRVHLPYQIQNGKQYLVFVNVVNMESLSFGLNMALTLRKYNVSQMLFVCGGPSCAVLKKSGLFFLSVEKTLQTSPVKRGDMSDVMWVRSVILRFFLHRGIGLVMLDADVVFTEDPRPILFDTDVDVIISSHLIHTETAKRFDITDSAALPFIICKDHTDWSSYLLLISPSVSRFDSTPGTIKFIDAVWEDMLREVWAFNHHQTSDNWLAASLLKILWDGWVRFGCDRILEKETVFLAINRNYFDFSMMAWIIENSDPMPSSLASRNARSVAQHAASLNMINKSSFLHRHCWLLRADWQTSRKTPWQAVTLAPSVASSSAFFSAIQIPFSQCPV